MLFQLTNENRHKYNSFVNLFIKKNYCMDDSSIDFEQSATSYF